MPSPIASSASQTITTVVFGITATVISIVTVWYSYRAFKIWHDRREVENTDLDIELSLAPTERFELPASRSFPNVAVVEAGPTPQPSHEATAGPSFVVPVGNHETSTTPHGIN